MGDLAIGISKTMVEALLKKVETAMKEEEELWRIVQDDTVFMMDELEMMQSFLNAADCERIKDSVVRTWVSQVRDLSYDAEDCIRSILLMDTNRSSFWTICLRLLQACCSCKSPAASPLGQAVAEIKLLRARVEDVRSRNLTYSLINDSGSNPQHVASVPAAIGTSSAVAVLAEAWCNAKQQRGLSVDLTMLVDENSDALRVISLWPTGGGLGMASVVINEAYEKPEICQKFRARAWLKLAHPFNPREFIRSLAHQFYANTCSEQRREDTGRVHGQDTGIQRPKAGTAVDILTAEMEAAQDTNLVRQFVQQLTIHKYLIVLEDLSNMAEWYAIRTYLPDSNNGSRIVVSTQNLEIARLCASQPYQILELKKLPDRHSICVFFNEAFERVEVGMVAGGSSLLGMDDEVSLVGRRSDLEKFSNLISSAGRSSTAHVISVWGFPGIGKSALVRTVLRQRRNDSPPPPFDWYAWVDVSYPFDFSDICRKMHSYMVEFEQSKGEYAIMPRNQQPDQEIIQECKKFFTGRRCLVVIDGLRSMEEWNLIKSLIVESSKCCILVVTREESVAKYCANMQHDAVHRVNALRSEAALDLFKQEFRRARTSRDAQMPTEGILIHVLAKCGGIPEVIISLARYAASLQQDVRQRKLNDLNANSMRELETKPEFVGLRDLFAWMHVRFDELPQSIKTCILYQSVFYQAKRIRRSHFVRRWIAEGYSKGTESKAMEGYTGELFDRLAKQITTMDEWRFNSFFHEYINSRLMEEGVVLFPLVVSVLEGTRSLTTQGMGQHLVIASSWKRDEEYLYEDMDVSHLQSLTVHGTWRPFFVPNKMKSVRVLDLEGTAHAGLGEDELGRILELLPRLRFLSIRGHRQITHLPDTLSGLKFLQTLDIRHTSVVYVQLEAALQELQYIRAGTTATAIASEEPSTGSCNVAVVSSYYLPKFLRRGPVGPCQGVRMPTGIRHLKNLHTLGAVHINSAGGAAILDDIYHLKQLKKLEVSGVNRENSERLCRSIINHKNLESLSLQLDKEKHVVCWDHIAPPPSVRSLKLYGHVLELSSPRFNNLRNLRKLTLETNSTIFMVNIQLLGRVPSLRTLHLQVKQNQDGTLLFSADLFSELEHLKLTCISRSKKYVIFDERAMKKLELLNVHCHDGSSLRFYGLKNPVSLTQVRVQGISGDAVQQYRDQLAEHPTRPALYLS